MKVINIVNSSSGQADDKLFIKINVHTCDSNSISYMGRYLSMD